MNGNKLNILQDYALLDDVARDTNVCTRTLRRRLAQGWPYLMWGGKVHLHIPTWRKLIDGEVKTRKPAKGR
jgi:hypothetical protein